MPHAQGAEATGFLPRCHAVLMARIRKGLRACSESFAYTYPKGTEQMLCIARIRSQSAACSQRSHCTMNQLLEYSIPFSCTKQTAIRFPLFPTLPDNRNTVRKKEAACHCCARLRTVSTNDPPLPDYCENMLIHRNSSPASFGRLQAIVQLCITFDTCVRLDSRHIDGTHAKYIPALNKRL